MTKQLPGEFKNFIKSYFNLTDSQYIHLIKKIDNRSVDNAVHKISAAPFRFLAQNSEFKAFAQKHENAQWLLSNPESAKVLNAPDVIEKEKRLNDLQVKKIFLKYPNLFDADFHVDNPGSPATRLKYNLYFYKNILGLSYCQILEINDNMPDFLMANIFADDQFSAINQIHSICKTFKFKLRDISKLLTKYEEDNRFARMIFAGNADNNFVSRAQSVLQLGLTTETIHKYPKICFTNPSDVKFRYMTQRYAFGIQKRQPSLLPYPFKLRHMNNNMSYARAMYIKDSGNKNLSKLYYATSEEFCANAGITSEQLEQKYPLTKSTAQEFLKLYNYKNPCKLAFNEQEMSRFVDDEGEAD